MDQIFTTLGLDKKERGVFLKLLQLGSVPVSLLANRLGLPRTSVYVILERLKALGVVQSFRQKGKTWVHSLPPEELKDLLLEKQRRVQSALEEYEENLPLLMKEESTLRLTPKVEFLEGKKGVIKAYKRVLKEKTFYSYFNPETVKKYASEIFLFIPENLEKKSGKAKELLVSCPEAKEYSAHIKNPNHEVKILPRGLDFASDVIICENSLYFFSYEKDQVCVVEITNKNLAETQRKMFELLWAKL